MSNEVPFTVANMCQIVEKSIPKGRFLAMCKSMKDVVDKKSRDYPPRPPFYSPEYASR